MEAEVGQVADEAGQELAPASAGAESEVERALEPEHEERASLSEKERQNEAVNERDNCSASSVSSSSSTLEREDKEDKLSRDKGTGKEAPAQGTWLTGLRVDLLAQLAPQTVPCVWRRVRVHTQPASSFLPPRWAPSLCHAAAPSLYSWERAIRDF